MAQAPTLFELQEATPGRGGRSPDGQARPRRPRHCPHCGQRIRPLNPHVMDARKVELLERIARLNAAGHRWVKIQRDGALIDDAERGRTIQADDVLALRLRWFGLVDWRRRRSGDYRVTSLGLDFLRGLRRIPRKIWCKDGEVRRVSEQLVGIHQVDGVVLDKDYWDRYAAQQVRGD